MKQREGSSCYIAIDSNLYKQINAGKNMIQSSNDSLYLKEFSFDDKRILDRFGYFIVKDNLQEVYGDFNPKLYSAWIKIQ